MVGNYSIVTWIFDNNRLDTPYNKALDVSEQLQALAASERAGGDARLTVFLNRVDVFSNPNALAVFDINQVIGDNNEEWKGILDRQIAAANTTDELGILSERFNVERNRYEDSTVEEVERAIVERRTQIITGQARTFNQDREEQQRRRGEERRIEAVQDIRNQIRNAETSDDLILPSLGEIERQFGKGTRNEISQLIADKLNVLESLEERDRRVIGRQIQSATTQEELNRINISDVSTYALEDELASQIERKRREL